jgi:hypothetical protein
VVSEQIVRLQLAQEVEAGEGLDAGKDVSSTDDHPSVMILNGLQIEEDQYVFFYIDVWTSIDFRWRRWRLAEDFKGLGLHPTSKQVASLSERSNRLRRRIGNWIETQEHYMPEARNSRQQDAKASADGVGFHKTQDIPLYLPSSYKFRKPLRIPELRMYELRLREGRAHDALHEMRQHLRIRTHLYQQKDKYARGVHHNTRANNAITKSQAKVDRAAEKYRASRDAMLALSDSLVVPSWSDTLRVLKDDDVRGLSEALMGSSEGTRSPSWIWTTNTGVLAGGADQIGDEGTWSLIPKCSSCQLPFEPYTTALRVEWCRCRARAMRYAEEVELLREEMRRVLAFLSWDRDRWKTRAANVSQTTNDAFPASTPSPLGKMAALVEGMRAYALEQASVRQHLFETFSRQWRDVPMFIKITDEALAP